MRFFEQKPLPYPMNGLEPVFTEEFLETFYGINHQTHVVKTNVLMKYRSTALRLKSSINHALIPAEVLMKITISDGICK